MKIVIAIDSFKGSLSSLEAGEAVKEGFLKAKSNAQIKIFPLADGGEGTTEALALGLGGKLIKTQVHDPLMRKITAEYGIIESENLAIMEMAATSGITLVNERERDILKATTYGVGEMIKDAIKRGIRNFIIGIGGSATNDCGAGMLQALGFKLMDKNGSEIPYGAVGLKDVYKIDGSKVMKELKEAKFRIACDVKNPLCGEKGCSYIYGPQKGATKENIPLMDSYISHFADVAKTFNSEADKEFPGTGAAGGLGFAFKYFLKGELLPGAAIITESIKIEEDIKDADLVVTGEGRLDSQTVFGKAPSYISSISKKYGKPCIAFSGCVSDDAEICNEKGIDAFFPILRNVTTLDEALNKKNAFKNLENTAEQVMRLINLYK
ncbi:MAG: glycerate kinase [Ruminococcaceae bacterium]|nr:glycerate kinase [Oscillospiraceae bacterium]